MAEKETSTATDASTEEVVSTEQAEGNNELAAIQAKLDLAMEQIQLLNANNDKNKADFTEQLAKAKQESLSSKKEVKGEHTDAQLQALQDANNELSNKLNAVTEARKDQEKLALFAGSSIMNELSIPSDMVKSYFSSNVSFDESDNMIVKDSTGNVIMSRDNIGSVANADEGLRILIESSPVYDKIKVSKSKVGVSVSNIPTASTVSSPLDMIAKGLNY